MGGGERRKKGRKEHETSHIRKIHVRKYSEEEEEEEGGSLKSKREGESSAGTSEIG